MNAMKLIYIFEFQLSTTLYEVKATTIGGIEYIPAKHDYLNTYVLLILYNSIVTMTYDSN